MINPIDPTQAINSSNSVGQVYMPGDDGEEPGDKVLLHRGNGEKFIFELPKEVKALNSPDQMSMTQPSVSAMTAQPSTFGHLAQDMIYETNGYQQVAGAKVRDVLMGGKTTIHEAMISVQESSVAFDMLAQMRNKLMDSYQELTRMQM